MLTNNFLHTDFFQKRFTVVHSYDTFSNNKNWGPRGLRGVGKRLFKFHTQPRIQSYLFY